MSEKKNDIFSDIFDNSFGSVTDDFPKKDSKTAFRIISAFPDKKENK